MMLEMKHVLRSILVVLVIGLAPTVAKSQTYQIQIDSIIGIPDTVYDGQEITFYMIISMNTPLFYQGDFFVELEYNGGFYTVDTANVANLYLGPSAPNTIQATHRLSTEDDLSIGDNVVVVWPRIGDGVNPPQEVVNPETVIITVVEPNGIENPKNERIFESFIFPNPADNSIKLKLSSDEKMKLISIYDIAGRQVQTTTVPSNINIEHLPKGVYFVDVLTEKGNVYSDKLMISH